uniref:Uncharacterized protein n=1 Tax=Arundo donax TaxID=35708 RepID=A0A0A9F143_ARUDO
MLCTFSVDDSTYTINLLIPGIFSFQIVHMIRCF